MDQDLQSSSNEEKGLYENETPLIGYTLNQNSEQQIIKQNQ